MFQHVKVIARRRDARAAGRPGAQGHGQVRRPGFLGRERRITSIPTAPHIGFGGDDASWKAFGQLKASPIGPLLFRDKQPVNKDGTFTIEKMLPGRYQLFLSAPGFTSYAASLAGPSRSRSAGRKARPSRAEGNCHGEETCRSSQPKAGRETAEKPAEKPAAKTITIRGKVLDDATGEPIGQLDHSGRQVRSGRSHEGDLGLQRRALQRPRRLVLDHHPLGRRMDRPHPGRRLHSAAGDHVGSAGRQGRD